MCARTIEAVCREIGNICDFYVPRKCQNYPEETVYAPD